MKKLLSWGKKNLLTLFGFHNTFKISLFNSHLFVDYNLRGIKPERDYSIILQLAKDKKYVFDVGANHGIISLLVAAQNKDTKIHAFEASETAVNVINHNLQLNNLDHAVRVVNSLIADKSGYAIPFYWEGSAGGASITKGRLGHQTEIYKATMSLDDYVQFFDISPDFIKMDIEGAESIAIKGMSSILKRDQPIVFIELHEFGGKKLYENAGDILSFITQFDYVMVYLKDGKVITNTEVLKDRGRCHVLILHKSDYTESFIQSLDLNGL